ncbi:hypothetical protein H4I95_05323 [Botrytis cinerea]
MLFLPFLYPALLTIFTFTPLTTAASKPKNAILLSKVKSLTLRDNAQTSHRRVSAVPQLSCSGPGCRHYKVDVMRCTNQGSDYSSEDIQWSCTANLPEEFKLGSTDVICEGYDSKDDEYVLKGSCAVEYRLLLTEEGEAKYGKNFWDDGSGDSSVEKGMGILFWLIFVGVLGWILYSMVQNWRQGPANGQAGRVGGGGGFGGWGGGGPGDDDPHHLIQELGNDLQETMVLLNKHGDLDFGLVRRQVLLAVILQETERIDKIKVAAGVAEVEVAGVEVLDLEAQAQALPLPILGQILDSALHREDSYPSNLD